MRSDTLEKMHLCSIIKKGQDHLTISIFLFLTLSSSLLLPINPWPRDRWFQTQYLLFGVFPGEDNYTPIAAPAILYKIIHLLSDSLGLALKAEMYLGSVTQNLLVFLSACFLYRACKMMGMRWIASLISIVYLTLILSTGLPQAFWSENIVLFLFSAVLMLTIKNYYSEKVFFRRFLAFSIMSGLLTGILVVTRVTPIILIPCLALLFYCRFNRKQLIGYVSIVLLTTALLIILAMSSNYYRFGRFELTNSSGRHLWQGVSPITDKTLSASPKYLALKRYNVGLNGKNWWEIRFPDGIKQKQMGDEVLGELAKEAILTHPLLYLKLGIKKFARNIVKPPYRLGFGKPRHSRPYNPLNREELLPPIMSTYLNWPRYISDVTFVAFNNFFSIYMRLYPLSIFFVLTSILMLGICAIDMKPYAIENKETAFSSKNLRVFIFFVLGFVTAGLVAFSSRSLLVALFCMILLIFQLYLLWKIPDGKRFHLIAHVRSYIVLYVFLSIMFFGSLWMTWQMEASNPRNAIPYFPFLYMMIGIAMTIWLNFNKGGELKTV